MMDRVPCWKVMTEWGNWYWVLLCFAACANCVQVRPWKEMVPSIMTMDNAYRPRKNEEDRIPHSFTFRKRESSSVQKFVVSLRCDFFLPYWLACHCVISGLPASMPLSERLPRRYEKRPNDVFAVVKHHMCDTEPCQPALLVLPGDEAITVQKFWDKSTSHRGVEPTIDPERQEEFLELAEAFEKYPNYERAVQYLKSLAGQVRRVRHAANDLPFVQSGRVHASGLVCGAVPDRIAKPEPHRLKVRFHRPK